MTSNCCICHNPIKKGECWCYGEYHDTCWNAKENDMLRHCVEERQKAEAILKQIRERTETVIKMYQETLAIESRVHNYVTGFYMLLDKDLKEFKAKQEELEERISHVEGVKDDLLNLAELARKE